MKYLDEIEYIRLGGRSRNGRCPDRLHKVWFIKLTDNNQFAYLYSKDNNQVGYGYVQNIIAVNGVPIQGQNSDHN